jgi:hypothetical protein
MGMTEQIELNFSAFKIIQNTRELPRDLLRAFAMPLADAQAFTTEYQQAWFYPLADSANGYVYVLKLKKPSFSTIGIMKGISLRQLKSLKNFKHSMPQCPVVTWHGMRQTIRMVLSIV